MRCDTHVTHAETMCDRFRAHTFSEAGLVSPAKQCCFDHSMAQTVIDVQLYEKAPSSCMKLQKLVHLMLSFGIEEARQFLRTMILKSSSFVMVVSDSSAPEMKWLSCTDASCWLAAIESAFRRK